MGTPIKYSRLLTDSYKFENYKDVEFICEPSGTFSSTAIPSARPSRKPSPTERRTITKAAAVRIHSFTIHGEKDQGERSDVMKRFKDGDCNILIATDISARGLDIPDVHYVINYDLAAKSENYVHRVGRIGRGFNKGVAISFCSKQEKERLEIRQFKILKR